MNKCYDTTIELKSNKISLMKLFGEVSSSRQKFLKKFSVEMPSAACLTCSVNKSYISNKPSHLSSFCFWMYTYDRTNCEVNEQIN